MKVKDGNLEVGDGDGGWGWEMWELKCGMVIER